LWKVTSGGIKRQKEHLAGTGGDATGCPRATTQLRREMLEYLEKNKRNIGLHVAFIHYICYL
jgi:hypothetical protein